jgi:hypothetical protein
VRFLALAVVVCRFIPRDWHGLIEPRTAAMILCGLVCFASRSLSRQPAKFGVGMLQIGRHAAEHLALFQ